jgi:hypothetical protein
MLATVLPSPIGDSAVEATMVVARCRCRVMLTIVLPSYASDGTIEATWPRCDVGADSWWRRRCRGDLATV